MNSYLYLILIWIHSMGAGIWLGGSLLYFLKSTVYKESNKTDFISEYNSVLTVSTIILFASGILISFDKLTFGNYSNFSAILLLTKVILSFIVIYLIWKSRNIKNKSEKLSIRKEVFEKPELLESITKEHTHLRLQQM